jgi:HemY protein
VTEADIMLEERRHQQALELLRRLPRRHTAALRLELKAQQQARNWGEVLALTDELRRRGVFDPTQADQLRRYALAEHLKRKAVDTRALEEAWDRVPSSDRAERRVALAAARGFIALGGCDRAHRIIEHAVGASWDSELVGLYAECEGGDTVRRI